MVISHEPWEEEGFEVGKARLLQLLGLLMALVLAVTVLSACGGSSSSSSESSTTSETTEAEPTESEPEGEEAEPSEETESEGSSSGAPAPLTEEPTEISVSEPLKKTPASGKTIGIVTAQAPLYAYLGKEFTKAVGTLGWKTKTFNYTTNPATAVSAALAANVDAIYGISLVEETIKPQLEEAKKAGIPVFTQGSPEPTNEATDFYTWNHNNDEEIEQSSWWILQDAAGEENLKIGYVDLPAIPYFKRSFEKLGDDIGEYCESCSVEQIGVTPEQLEGGKVASVVAAYLQNNPDTNYVVFGYGDLMTGVVPQLKAAGVTSSTKLFCGGANGQEVMELVANNEIAGAVAGPTAAQTWLATYIIGRFFNGEKLSPPISLEMEEPGVNLPAKIWVPDAEQAAEFGTKEFGWEGPQGYEKKFEELWNVG
jgi:ribose transport system substrate-binding protein